VDALIANSPEKVTYASDHLANFPKARREIQAYVILPRNRFDQAWLVTLTSNFDLLVDELTWIGSFRRHGYFRLPSSNRCQTHASTEGEQVGIAAARAGAMAGDVYEPPMKAVRRRLAHYERATSATGSGSTATTSRSSPLRIGPSCASRLPTTSWLGRPPGRGHGGSRPG
jgi:hypothetical protein